MNHPLQHFRHPCKQEHLLYIRACANNPRDVSVPREPYSSVSLILLQAGILQIRWSIRNCQKEIPWFANQTPSISTTPASRRRGDTLEQPKLPPKQSLIPKVMLFSISNTPASRDVFFTSEYVPTTRRQSAHLKNHTRWFLHHFCKQK